MPGTRVLAILDEIARIATNPNVKLLTDELGELIAKELGTTRAALMRLKEDTTSAIVDSELTLDAEITKLRAAIIELNSTFVEFNANTIKRRIELDQHNETISGRVHTLANHMFSVENKVNELAEIVTAIHDSINNADSDTSYNDNSDTTSDDDQLHDPYAT